MNETREEREASAMRLRANGLLFREIAQELGCSTGEVTRLLHPEKRERDRQQTNAAKHRRRGTCERCGGETKYSGKGGEGVSRVCIKCAPDEYRKWDEAAIISAMRRWEATHGRQPVSRDWLISSPDNFGYPDVTVVQNVFGSWNAGIEAAGYEPLPTGHRTPEGNERMRLALLKWSKAEIVREIQDRYTLDGVSASTTLLPGAFRVAVLREFGSWERACFAAGVTPRGHTFRDRSCVCGFGPSTARGVLVHRKACKR